MELNQYRYDPHPENAIGKRKVEDEGSALSLQDVFSDSANLTGMQQKTSCLPVTGQGKWVATPGKEVINNCQSPINEDQRKIKKGPSLKVSQGPLIKNP